METVNFDPGLALGKVALKIIQLFLAFCVAVFGGLTYLAYQGGLNDWVIQFNFSFWKYQPEPGSIFWSTLVFGAATGICLTAFFLSRWLEKKI
ncbi:MAG: hypothetical protein P8O16_04085 [Algoriphagus sp.]|uniref:hypothetical protein n=1 Tax=Algoriphagus sp. TaxID=1872435 RepID=UPI00260917F9|nr:hypothetical protein [Algoriphagus sp.]MDG1276434.1 hypothetical protein [Algoriphagus sp.]